MEREARRKKIASQETDHTALITGRIHTLDPNLSKSSSFSNLPTQHSRSTSEPAGGDDVLDRFLRSDNVEEVPKGNALGSRVSGQSAFPMSAKGRELAEKYRQALFPAFSNSGCYLERASALAGFYYDEGIRLAQEAIDQTGYDLQLDGEVLMANTSHETPRFTGNLDEDPSFACWQGMYEGLVQNVGSTSQPVIPVDTSSSHPHGLSRPPSPVPEAAVEDETIANS